MSIKDKILKAVAALDAYDKVTKGGWQTYDEMEKVETGEYYAGDWLDRDEVLKTIREIE